MARLRGGPDLNLRDLLNSLARQWYVVLAGLLLTSAIGVGLYGVIPVSYTSQASVVLLPPKSASDPDANPFLRLGGLSQAVDILTRTINSDAYSVPLIKQNPGAKFTTAADTTTSGPIILIESSAPTSARASQMTQAVLTAVPMVLDQIQAKLSVKTDSQINVTTIAVDQKPKLDAKTRLQLVLGVSALGVVLSILITGLIDGLTLSRRRRIADETSAKRDKVPVARAASTPAIATVGSRTAADIAPQRPSKGRQPARSRRPQSSTPTKD